MRINATTNLVYLPYLLKTGGIHKRQFFQKLYDKGIENITNEELILLTLVAYSNVCEENQSLDQLYITISSNQHKLIQHIYYNLRVAFIPKHYAGVLDYFLEMIFDSIKERNQRIKLRKVELKRKLASLGIYERISQLFQPNNKVSQDLFELVCNRLSSNYYKNSYTDSKYTLADAMSAPHIPAVNTLPAVPVIPAVPTDTSTTIKQQKIQIPVNATPSTISRTINESLISMMKPVAKQVQEPLPVPVPVPEKKEHTDYDWYNSPCLEEQKTEEQQKTEDEKIEDEPQITVTTTTTVVETPKKKKNGKK